MTNEELVQEYQNGNHQALDDLINQNNGLVYYFANKYLPICPKATMDMEDLLQEGWMGFVDAAQKYDPNKPLEKEEAEPICLEDEEENKAVMFSSYAGRAIQNNILRAINRSIPRKKKSDTYSEPIMVNSVNAFLPGSDDTTLEELLPDEGSMESFKDIEEDFDNKLLRKDLIQMLDSVFGGEFQFNGIDFKGVDNINSLFHKVRDGITAKEVLLLHYGLFGKEMSFKEIGKQVGLTGSRIEQIEFAGIKRIRKSEQGKDFMTKYEVDYVDELLFRKQMINKYSSPEKVVDRIESIDNLLKQYI
ncbi:RNA polymerase sigma-32 subunit RpoH [Clostridium sartagoforme AAU1]|uniref:RNA polymerase sigma-32 subunit RpoH n=1 Tax=Clostridium sartagoforme AAU1 TaxID=1202534 RepID=R9C7G8_9CLOT|nr:sigma factor [Clostridium sartagoforme]EOR25309.1 RNA polymerase sigma-32 subunit RpoH [Clostridium sartagoforme AAU1]